MQKLKKKNKNYLSELSLSVREREFNVNAEIVELRLPSIFFDGRCCVDGSALPDDEPDPPAESILKKNKQRENI